MLGSFAGVSPVADWRGLNQCCSTGGGSRGVSEVDEVCFDASAFVMHVEVLLPFLFFVGYAYLAF